jgi:hypothetical protein
MGMAGANPVDSPRPGMLREFDQVLVEAMGALIAPAGRAMYFSAVVLPWYRLVAT